MVHSVRKLVQTLAHFLYQFFVLSDIDVLCYIHLFFSVNFLSQNSNANCEYHNLHIFYTK